MQRGVRSEISWRSLSPARAVRLLFGRCFANVITRLAFPLFPRKLLYLLFHVLQDTHPSTQLQGFRIVSLV